MWPKLCYYYHLSTINLELYVASVAKLYFVVLFNEIAILLEHYIVSQPIKFIIIINISLHMGAHNIYRLEGGAQVLSRML